MDKASIRSTGAVYTPPNVAAAITRFVADLMPGRALRILEPSVGDGAFLDALSMTFADEHHFTFIDIDGDVIAQVGTRLGERAAELATCDFIRFATELRASGDAPYDLIIGNPPFIRKHNYSDRFKENLSLFSDEFKYPLSNLKNSWAAFLVGSADLIGDNGVVAFVLPYEMLTVDYGQTVLLDYMRPAFERIDIFVSDDKAFKEIDQDAVIFIGRRRAANDERGLFINRVSNFDNLVESSSYKMSHDVTLDRSLALNGFLLPNQNVDLFEDLRNTTPKLSDYADSAPGIVSAANEFFILTARAVEQYNLGEHVLPILKKGSLAGVSPIFSAADFAQLAVKGPCLLLAVGGDKSGLDEALLSYLDLGEARNFHKRYKCRNRRHWYEVPVVKREAGFFFKRSHSLPRIIINEADVFITDTAYGLRMKEDYSIRGLCFSFYTSLTMLFAEIDGRFYGGGVLELSPREFRGLPLIYHEPTYGEWRDFLTAHAEADGNADRILDFGDTWVARDHGVSAETLQKLRNAWSVVRSHRMRHGRR
jgi:adenine-specific DNA methylase